MRYFLLAAVAACLPSAALASISQSDFIANQINVLEDDDFERLVNAGETVLDAPGDTRLEVGDYLTGIIRFTAIEAPFGSGTQVANATSTQPTITALFLTKITSVTGDNDNDNVVDTNFTFGAPTLAEWAAVYAGTGVSLPTTEGTVAIVYEDPDNVNPNIATWYLTANGTKLYEWGFRGDGNESWSAGADTNDTTNAFDGIPPVGGSFQAALNVTKYHAGIPLTGLFGPGTPEILFLGGSLTGSSNSRLPVRSDVDILIRPVPEPTTIATWAGLVAAASLVAGRRRS